jgi:hypothetical protein
MNIKVSEVSEVVSEVSEVVSEVVSNELTNKSRPQMVSSVNNLPKIIVVLKLILLRVLKFCNLIVRLIAKRMNY